MWNPVMKMEPMVRKNPVKNTAQKIPLVSLIIY